MFILNRIIPVLLLFLLGIKKNYFLLFCLRNEDNMKTENHCYSEMHFSFRNIANIPPNHNNNYTINTLHASQKSLARPMRADYMSAGERHDDSEQWLRA